MADGFDCDVVVESHLGEVLNAKNEQLLTAITAVAIQAHNHAKLNLEHDPRRIDTGNLRNSIDYEAEIDGNVAEAIIGTNVEYAPYVHFGTSKMEPNRFLQNAVAENTEEFRAIVEQYLKE